MCKIRINQGRIVPWHIRWVLTVGVFLGMYVALGSLEEKPAILTAIGLSMILPFIWSAYRLLEVDPARGEYSKSIWVTGMKWETKHAMTAPVNLAIRQGRDPNGDAFESWLILEGGDELYLAGSDDQEYLQEKSEGVAKKLGVPLRLIPNPVK
jgi:hypothetical protein